MWPKVATNLRGHLWREWLALPSTKLPSQPIAPGASSIFTPLQDPHASQFRQFVDGDDEWHGKECISDSDVDEERGQSEDVEMAVDAKNQSEE
jgi:hypothetical protein